MMFEGDGLTKQFWGNSDAAGSLEGRTKTNAEFLNRSNRQADHYSERYGGVKMLGGAGGDGEEPGDLEMMQEAAAQIFEHRTEVDDERRLAAIKVPFLRELLATFHRISDLPDEIGMEEERLYVGEAIQSLQRMQTLLTQTAAGAHHLMDPIDEMFYRRPRHAADLLVQNLTMILKNPNNRCFANSVIRLWAWLPVFNPMKAKEMWGNTTRAMEVILSAPGRIDLEEVPEMEAFWNWHPLEVQADTADFVHSLWSVAQSKGISGRYWATTSYGAVQEKQRMPLDIPYYPEAGEQSLQELIYAWVEEDHGHSLSSGQEAIILQIGRFQKVKEKWAKHHKPVEIEHTITFPSSGDGIHIHKQTYKVAGMILHQGQEHSSGHFTTIQCYDDVLWYIDDDQPPEPIEALTEQMKKEIFMVWLIRDPHQSNSPTMSTITEDEAEAKSKKQKIEHKIRLQMLNVTNYGKQVETWAMKLEDPTFLVETHVGTDKLEEKLQYLETRGKKVIAMPAHPTGQGGTHGGIFLLYDRDQMIHKLEEFSIMGHGWLAAQWTFQDFSLVVIGVYMKSGEGIQGRTNADIWASLVAYLRNLQKPFVVLGDFNEDPDEVAKTKIAPKAGAEILRTAQETTLLGSEIDWGLISRMFAPIATLQTSWDVPSRPHCMLVMEMEAGFEKKLVQQLKKYPPISRMTQAKWPWSAFTGQDHNVEILGEPIQEVDKSYAKWASKAEEYVLQDYDQPKKGRGARIELEHKELTKPHQQWMWKRGAMAYWGQLTSVLNHARIIGHLTRRAKHLVEHYVYVMNKHWQEDQGMREMQDELWQLTQQWNHDSAARLEMKATHQEALAKTHTLEEETQQYREWLAKGYTRGFKALFKTMKRNEEPFLRPFQDKSYEERMQCRMQQWGSIWKIRQTPLVIDNHDEIIQKGIAQAQQWQEIQLDQAKKIIQQLGQKAAGPDGLSNDLLKCLPWEGIKELVREIELTGKFPQQYVTSLIVMIPKCQTIERPIALVNVLHRLWCKLRRGPILQWQKDVQHTMEWERALPGNQCLWIAIKRLMRAETFKERGKFVASVLCDLKNFYDRICLRKLCSRWESTGFPAVHSMFATELYTGLRMMEAESEVSSPFYTEKGILAGDPLAPQIAKVYLHETMMKFTQAHPDIKADVWVDDISFDIIEDTPGRAAAKALQATRDLKRFLEEDELVMSVEKTGIVVNNKQIKSEITPLLQPGDPQVKDIMRDLGCDSSGGRLRRIKTMKDRGTKASRRMKKLQSLKIPSKAVKVRLCKGGIQATNMWGIEAQGLPPQKRQVARLAIARCLGLKKKGNLDILFDLHARHQDPGDLAMEKQLKVFHQVLMTWPEEHYDHLEAAWQSTRQRLEQATHAWKVVKGPMAAVQAFLAEGGWQHEDLKRWYKPMNEVGPALEINMEDSWPVINETLQEDFKRRRVQRIQKLTGCEFIHRNLDWKVHRAFVKKGSHKADNALNLWHQGALQTHEDGQYKMCPRCHERADATHLIWQCKWMKEKFGEIPQEWQRAIDEKQEKELWSRGIVQLPPPEVPQGASSIVCHGTWQDAQPHMVQQGDKLVLHVMAAGSDHRVKHYITGLVHYNNNDERQGCIFGIVTGRQTQARAWFYGLLMIHNYVPGSSKVHVANAEAFAAWQAVGQKKGFKDLAQDLSKDSPRRVKAIYVRAQHLDHYTHAGVLLRMQDAAKAVKEQVHELPWKETQKRLKQQDARLDKIYQAAVLRIQALLEDKTHFFHVKDEQGPERRQKTRFKKKEFYEKLGNLTTPGGHVWRQEKHAKICTKCNKRISLMTPYKEMMEVMEEQCDDTQPMGARGSKRQTRDEFLQELIQNQKPGEGHEWQVQGHYLRYSSCGLHCAKRCNLEELRRHLDQPCHNGPAELSLQWQGHPSHSMWRRGAIMQCQGCQAKAVKKDGHFASTSRLQKPCQKRAEKETTSISNFFKRKE